MPVLVVKSFPSSTSALAGSQAAQHNVNCLASAAARPLRDEATTTTIAPNARIVRIITTSLLLQAIARLPCHHTFRRARRSVRPFSDVTETLFSNIVKRDRFTKHLCCQATFPLGRENQVLAALQLLPAATPDDAHCRRRIQIV